MSNGRARAEGATGRRLTRWASLAGLLWLTGCLDLCGGEYELQAAAREVRAHEYASAESVWPHVRAAMNSHGVQSVPDVAPATDDWVDLPPTPGQYAQTQYRVRLERTGNGPGVRFRAESAAPGRTDFRSSDDVELDVLRAADPAAVAPIEQRREAGRARVQRGCSTGYDAGCAVFGACWRAGGGQGCD